MFSNSIYLFSWENKKGRKKGRIIMKKTLVVFGLYQTLIKFDEFVYSEAPEMLIMLPKGVKGLLDGLREIKKQNKTLIFT